MSISYQEANNTISPSSGIYGLTGCEAKWGNLGLAYPVRTQQEFRDHFGDYFITPYSNKDLWMQAYDFLKYSTNLYFYRFGYMETTETWNVSDELSATAKSANAHIFINNVAEATDTAGYTKSNAVLSGADYKIYFRANDLIGERYEPTLSATHSLFIASRYPGIMGNDFKISIATDSDNFSTTDVFDDTDPDIDINYSFSELFDRRCTPDEFAIVVHKDYKIYDAQICSLVGTAYNFADNTEFNTIIIKTASTSTLPASVTEEALLFGKNDTEGMSGIASHVSAIGFQKLYNLGVAFFAQGEEAIGDVEDILINMVAEKSDSQMVIFAGEKDVNITGVVKLPPKELSSTDIGKTFIDPVDATTFTLGEYAGDMAGLVVSKLNDKNYSEIISLPDKEFIDIYSVYDYSGTLLETMLTDEYNYIKRKGDKFFLEGNFSDVTDGIRKYLNIRLILLYAELQIESILRNLLFESNVSQSLVGTKIRRVRDSVRKYIKTFDYVLTVDGKNIECDLYIEMNKPYRSLRFDIDYRDSI